MPRWSLGLPIVVLLVSACSGAGASAVVDAAVVDADDGGPQVIVGSGSLGVQVWESLGVARYSIGSHFRKGSPPPEVIPSSCSQQTVGACVSQKCIPAVVEAGAPTDAGLGPESDNDASNVPYEPPVYGGDLTISGLLGPNPDSGVQGPDIILNAQNRYGDEGYRVLWNGGEKLHVSTTGADAPPFELDVIAPTRVEITSPILVDGFVIDRSVPFTLVWTPTSAGDLTVKVVRWKPSGDYERLSCLMPASAGTGTIPAAALALLTPGTDSYIVFSHTSAATVVKNGWKFTTTLFTDLRGNAFAHPIVK